MEDTKFFILTMKYYGFLPPPFKDECLSVLETLLKRPPYIDIPGY